MKLKNLFFFIMLSGLFGLLTPLTVFAQTGYNVHFDSEKGDPIRDLNIIEDKGDFFFPVRGVVEKLGGTYNYNAKSKTLNIDYFDSSKIEIQPWKKYFKLNGNVVNLSRGAFIKDGRMYVSEDFLLKALKTKIVKAGTNLEIITGLRYFKADSVTYLLDVKTQNLYIAKGKQSPRKICQLDTTNNYDNIFLSNVKQTEAGNYLVTIYYQAGPYGEPSTLFQIDNYFVSANNNVSYKTTLIERPYIIEKDNVTTQLNGKIFLPGTNKVLIIEDKTATLLNDLDLAELFEDNYEYRYIYFNNDYLLVRQLGNYSLSYLVLLSLKTGEKVYLHDEVLSQEDINFIKQRDPADIGVGGNLEFVEEKDGFLYLKYTKPFREGEQIYRYKIN